ncbi:unnamed protein product [Eruca vesicaria subsp. sativa]|uniref:Uncharacterized protein n=1 Tax=Eruca vesicaria subsp. sativa TaxID=29727 RepID=A0ABC8KP61_ERUVS|nr:unnamed protein product [Eruca vesicaria subsp. sativa]
MRSARRLRYMAKLSVYDKSEQAVFNNESVGADEVVPVPQTLVETIGQTRRFIVKVSAHNLTGKTQTITVTKVLPPEQPQLPIEDAVDEKTEGISGGHGSEEVTSG